MTGLAETGIVLHPLVPWMVLWTLAAMIVAAQGYAVFRRLGGWPFRLLAAAVLLVALAGPMLQRERREPLDDIVLLVDDASASDMIGDRPAQRAEALAGVEGALAAFKGIDVRRVTVGDAAEDGGTRLLDAIGRALAEEPRGRVAGVVAVTDGQIHDGQLRPDLPAPLQVLLTGHAADWDRRLNITRAPAFGIIGKETSIGLRIDEQGAVPPGEQGQEVRIGISIDGGAPETYDIPVGQDLELPLRIDHAGQNVVRFQIPTAPGELTDRNNMAAVQINGVRDRLRVLLVSGEPYAGERTWRNLLKSDSSVDLVHFTILRPPDKDDGVPVNELSLIAFPTRELFVEKINEFDLIIFDRYPQRGILPADYLDNIRDYVLKGGAVLVSAGPDFASVESLYYSGLGAVLPAAPTARVLEGLFLPTVTETGRRHPVTEALEAFARNERNLAAPGDAPWGRWLRHVELADAKGEVVMEAPGEGPLLILDRAGEGRVALLGSDQAWLWSRGFEGGGPQQELLRRLAHWLMKEPQLEEEALTADVEGNRVTITRRTMAPDGARSVTVTLPDGKTLDLALDEVRPGLYRSAWSADQLGLYRLKEGDLSRVFVLGPAAPREFENAVPATGPMAPVVGPTLGGFTRIEDGLPVIRAVGEGRPALGRGWIGITPRGAHRTLDVSLVPLMPVWVALVLALALSLLGWLAEGRRRRGGVA